MLHEPFSNLQDYGETDAGGRAFDSPATLLAWLRGQARRRDVLSLMILVASSEIRWQLSRSGTPRLARIATMTRYQKRGRRFREWRSPSEASEDRNNMSASQPRSCNTSRIGATSVAFIGVFSGE